MGEIWPRGAATDISACQPDGFLTEERKAADDDQGFSTFFSETGTFGKASRFQKLELMSRQGRASTSLAPSTATLNRMWSTRFALAPTADSSTPNT
jgi:hypothetical protein